MSTPLESSHTIETPPAPAPGALPPEVEAELRRRQNEATAAPPPAPWLQPAAPAAPATAPPPSPRPEAPLHSSRGESLRRLGPIGVLLATLLKYLPFVLKFGFIA